MGIESQEKSLLTKETHTEPEAFHSSSGKLPKFPKLQKTNQKEWLKCDLLLPPKEIKANKIIWDMINRKR